MCPFLWAMAILTPNYSFIGKDKKKNYPINTDILEEVFPLNMGAEVGMQFL